MFQIYNPTLEAGKPNVTIEYKFHRKLPEGEKFFNKTNPQQLNAQTLPPTFDVAATQMLPGGQSVPLASFPPGDYRMEIKITDGIAEEDHHSGHHVHGAGGLTLPAARQDEGASSTSSFRRFPDVADRGRRGVWRSPRAVGLAPEKRTVDFA